MVFLQTTSTTPVPAGKAIRHHDAATTMFDGDDVLWVLCRVNFSPHYVWRKTFLNFAHFLKESILVSSDQVIHYMSLQVITACIWLGSTLSRGVRFN